MILMASLLGCSLLVTSTYSNYIAELSIKQNLNYASQLSNTIITTISNLEADLRVMSKLSEFEVILRKESALDESDAEHFEQAINKLLNFNRQMYYYLSSLTLYTVNGHRLNYGYHNHPLEDVFRSRYYTMGMTYPVNLVWLGYNRETEKFEAVKMIYDENYIITGMMVLMFTDNYFNNMMAESRYTGMTEIYLINEQNQIMYALDDEKIGENLDPLLVAQMQKTEGYIESNGSLAIYHKLEGIAGYKASFMALVPSWRVVLMMNRATLMQEADTLTSSLSLLIVFFALLTIIIIACITHLTTQPINSLSQAIKSLATNVRFEQQKRQKDSFYREANELIDTYNYLITKINQLIDDNLAEKQMSLRMQQKILESQLAPHFLFNALQVISLQAREANDELVYKTIGNLSYLLTVNLRNTSQFTSVTKELQYIQAYMSIIEAKFEDKIGYEIHAEPELMEFFIPKFMLQPLVENAIVHGLIPKFGKGHMWIRIRIEGNFVEFTVKDDGVGISQAQREQILMDATAQSFSHEQNEKHIGIVNIIQRLQIIYQDRFEFLFESERYEGTQITIRLPWDSGNNKEYVKVMQS